jgi:hypothetical protein
VKILAKDFHRIFRAQTKSALLALGFKPSKVASQGWQRIHEDYVFVFWPQIDKYGWFDGVGSRMAFNFSLSPKATTSAMSINATADGMATEVAGRWCRLSSLLSTEELEQIRCYNNALVARIGLPEKNNLVWKAYEASSPGLFASVYGEVLEPLKPGGDFWLRYHDVEDIEWIGLFLANRMPALLARFVENPKISAFGEAFASLDS